MKYLTPAQYIRADEGLLATPNLPLSTIRRFITRAEAMIDSYVGFDARYGGFEPHNMWYQAYWIPSDHQLKTRIPIWPVPVRNALRYRIQISMIGSNNPTGGFFATIQPGDIAYNTMNNYIEIVPLQAVLYSMLPFFIELGMNPPVTQLDVEMGYYLDAIGETCDDAGNHQDYYAQRGFWATTYNENPSIIPNQMPVVGMMNPYSSTNGGASYTQNPLGLPFLLYKNGTPLTTNLQLSSPVPSAANRTAGQVYVDPTEGQIAFGTANLATDVITASYTYQIPDAVHEATINQVTYLLAQRDLVRQGMKALDTVQTDQQALKRHNRSSAGDTAMDEPGMDAIAMQLLDPYKQWAIA